MSLTTHSKFYFGFEVSDSALWIDFDEGGSELSAELEIGDYTITDFAAEVARAMNAAGGALTYSVSVDRATRKFTVSATGTFSLLVATGSHIGTTAFGMAGFTGADRTGASSYEGDAAGSVYATQFILQSYIGPEDSQDSIYGTVNQAASGDIEVVSFGSVRFIEANIKYANDFNNGASAPIRYNATGVDDLRTFMQFLVTKAPLEFMPDEDTPSEFFSVHLESTQDDSKGLKYKLKELYGQGLPGYFETGALTFRVIE